MGKRFAPRRIPISLLVSATVETVSLVTLLKDYTYVDFLDSDIQKHELAACKAPGAMEALNEKVGFIHFGIHGFVAFSLYSSICAFSFSCLALRSPSSASTTSHVS